MIKRIRFKQSLSFRERLAAFASEARERASKLPPGQMRDDMLRNVRHAELAAQLEDWVNSPGLQPPK